MRNNWETWSSLFTAEIVQAISQLPHLTHLEISVDESFDGMMHYLGSCRSLIHLDISQDFGVLLRGWGRLLSRIRLRLVYLWIDDATILNLIDLPQSCPNLRVLKYTGMLFDDQVGLEDVPGITAMIEDKFDWALEFMGKVSFH
jgi:hypothetical protein